jgi:hypothetical protein
MTNVSGDYTITAPSSESVINFSHVSYVFQEKKIGTESNIDVSLAAAEKSWRKL